MDRLSIKLCLHVGGEKIKDHCASLELFEETEKPREHNGFFFWGQG
jgi:hypothetical protein